MKNIKEMIIPILLGFTLVVSVYSSVKVIQNEKDIDTLSFQSPNQFSVLTDTDEIFRKGIIDNRKDIRLNKSRIENNRRKVSDLESEISDLKGEIDRLERNQNTKSSSEIYRDKMKFRMDLMKN
jgi:predicted RNase H-like nuclease (RuvC/YqgF family)